MTHNETELALTFCNAPLGLLSADLRAAFDAHVAAGGQTMAYLTSGWAGRFGPRVPLSMQAAPE